MIKLKGERDVESIGVDSKFMRDMRKGGRNGLIKEEKGK